MMEETLKRLEKSFEGIRGDIASDKNHYFYLNNTSYKNWSEPSRIELRKSFTKSLNWVLKNSSIESSTTLDSITLIEALWKVKHFQQLSPTEETEISSRIEEHLERILPSDGLFSDIGENPCALLFNELSSEFIVLFPMLYEMGVLGTMPAGLIAKQLLGDLQEKILEFSDRSSADGFEDNTEDTSGGGAVDPLRCCAVLNLAYTLDLQKDECKEIEEYVYECVENELLSTVLSERDADTVTPSDDDALYAVAKVVNALNLFPRPEGCFSDGLKAAGENKILARIGHALAELSAEDCAKRILAVDLVGILEEEKTVRDSVGRGELKVLLKKQLEDGSWADKNITGLKEKNPSVNRTNISSTLHAMLAVHVFLKD